MALCGPKFLRGIKEPCDGSCCGLGKDGMPDPVLTEKLKRRADAWRRILGTDKSPPVSWPMQQSNIYCFEFAADGRVAPGSKGGDAYTHCAASRLAPLPMTVVCRSFVSPLSMLLS